MYSKIPNHLKSIALLGIAILSSSLQVFAVLVAPNELFVSFDNTPLNSGAIQQGIPEHLQDGFLFQPIGGSGTSNMLALNGGAQGVTSTISPFSGTLYLQRIAGFRRRNPHIQILRTDGQRFSLLSFSIAEYSSIFDDPVDAKVIGIRPNGTQIQHNFTIDGLLDGPGGFDDFQVVTLPNGFSNLVRVELSTADNRGYSIDSFAFTVPEPSAAILGMFSILVIGLRRRRCLIAKKI